MLLRLSTSAQHPRWVLVSAAVLIVASAWFGLPLTQLLSSRSQQFQDPASQYERANASIHHATGQSAYDGLVILLAYRDDQVAPRQVAAATSSVMALLRRQHGLQRLECFPADAERGAATRDGGRAVVMAAFSSPRASVIAAAQLRGASVRSVDRLRVLVGGPDVIFHELTTRTRGDLASVELFAFPLLFGLCVWIFGGVLAAFLPLLLGGCSVLVAFLVLRLVASFVDLSIFALDVTTGLGLGLGLDYSLLMLTRYREECACGDRSAALHITLQTAGRTVFWSAAIVCAALSSLLLFPVSFLYSMGIAGIATALSAGGLALTVLPATFVLLSGHLRPAGPATSGRFWRWLPGWVLKRPGRVALVTVAALLATATFGLPLRFIAPSAQLLPASAPSLRVEAALDHDFRCNPAAAIPTVFSGYWSQYRAARFAAQAQHLVADRCGGTLEPRYLGRRTWEVIIPCRGSPYTTSNQKLVAALRRLAAPRGGLVSGLTAYFVDQRSSIANHLPGVILLLIGVIMVMLFSATGSLVIPVKALCMNAVTAAVAGGLLVLIFQDGVLAQVLGFTPIGGLEEANLIVLLVIAFTLSTDYEVFLMTRIAEAHERGVSNRDAIAVGLERTGRIVTSAALLFCFAVGAFAFAELLVVKQFGVGAALTVFIDATVIRMLLVPSAMALMGERNWWAPAPLRQLRSRFVSRGLDL